MKIYDITIGLSETMPIYAGDPTVSISAAKSIASGSSANVTQIAMGVHSGTHVDAPNHFIDGARRVHELDPAKLVGPCRVVGLSDDVMAIAPEHVGDIAGVERILFKTRNSAFWNEPEYLSIEKSGSPGHPVHIALLEKEIVILEGADLREIEPGDYELICLPLKYEGGGGDGSPARTFLREI